MYYISVLKYLNFSTGTAQLLRSLNYKLKLWYEPLQENTLFTIYYIYVYEYFLINHMTFMIALQSEIK